MTLLTVTASGQVTLKDDALKHLGIHAGDSVQIDLLPNGTVVLRPLIEAGAMLDVDGASSISPYFTVEEIRDAIEAAWAATD